MLSVRIMIIPIKNASFLIRAAWINFDGRNEVRFRLAFTALHYPWL